MNALVEFIDGLLVDMENKAGMSQRDIIDMLLDIRSEATREEALVASQ